MADPATSASPAEEVATTPAPDAPETVSVESQVQDAKPDTAEPSPAEGAKPASMFDAVKATLNKDPAPEESPASAKTSDKTDTETQEPDEEDEPDTGQLNEEEKKLLAPKTQRRIQRLARERDELKEPAQRFQKLQSFMNETGLSSDDVVNTLDIAALIVTDPAKAYERIGEIQYKLAQSLGKVLPPDIQERVDKGVIDEKTGQELAQTRARATHSEQVSVKTREQVEAEQQAQFKSAVSTSVSAWEKTVTARDPDFARKSPLVRDRFMALVQSKQIVLKTPEDAVRGMKEAYKHVNETVKAFSPAARPEIRPTPATTATAAEPRPKSLEDAIRQRLAGAAA